MDERHQVVHRQAGGVLHRLRIRRQVGALKNEVLKLRMLQHQALRSGHGLGLRGGCIQGWQILQQGALQTATGLQAGIA